MNINLINRIEFRIQEKFHPLNGSIFHNEKKGLEFEFTSDWNIAPLEGQTMDFEGIKFTCIDNDEWDELDDPHNIIYSRVTIKALD